MSSRSSRASAAAMADLATMNGGKTPDEVPANG